MEIRRRFDIKYLLVGLYLFVFGLYLIIGFSPVGATNYEISAELIIPSIGLDTDVTTLWLKDHRLETPDTIVGSFSNSKNKTLLIGHSSTVFSNLKNINIGDEITYDDTTYVVNDLEIVEKNQIDMAEILSSEEIDTVVLMTCAGELFNNGDATHRLIIYASKA